MGMSENKCAVRFSEEGAKEAMKEGNIAFINRRRYGIEHCADCGSWHLTCEEIYAGDN